jgi:hypothetical protein
LVNAVEFLICRIILNEEYLKKLIENSAQFYLTFLLLIKLNIWFFNKRVNKEEETNAFRDFERAFDRAALIFERKSNYFYDLNSTTIYENGFKLSFIFRVTFLRKITKFFEKTFIIYFQLKVLVNFNGDR